MAINEFIKLIRSRRTIRQFKQDEIPLEILKECVESARLAPSASNLQPIKYLLITDREKVKRVFPLLRWAAYITPRGNPEKGKEPVGYLVILIDKNIRSKGYEYDVGAAVENFILSALSYGIATCWLLSVDREKLREEFQIPENFIIDTVVAFGYPAETSVIEESKDGNIKYWKDEKDVFHVPKRPLEEILFINSMKG
ncbi:MAG: nitroreductase family protein [Candidatus Marinimicrobia bacterium]|nr:nitroreductase family protein [Candidatus Neomarinimicrobiota bacterium]